MSLVLLLVGPKGSGKTTVGRLVADALGGVFLDVEALARRVLAEHGGVFSDAYAAAAFRAMGTAVDEAARAHVVVVFETTGASEHALAMIDALRAPHDLRLVRIRASAETCSARIASRDPSRQIALPDELVRAMHSRTEALDLPWDVDVTNEDVAIELVASRIVAALRAERHP